MHTLEEIKSPIAREMEYFEEHFRSAVRSRVPLLDRITHYIVKRKGKQMRPMFVLLSAGLCGGINDKSYRAATLIELLHTATLVHDDVVDDSNVRRGFFSINALWKNKVAVLVGDYLLSEGLLLSVKHEDYDLLKIVSEAVRLMSEGELLQIEKARRLDIREDIYFNIIRQKTASLIASCCACGALSAGADAERTENMRQMGEYIGIAFQIKDDLFDYGSEGIIGKPTGMDIRESKLTLPLIYALSHASGADKRKIINTIKNDSTNTAKVKEVVAMVKSSGGIEYAVEQMKQYSEKAYGLLGSFPDSTFKQSLRALVYFTIERTH